MMNFLCSLTIFASLCSPTQLGALSVLKPSQGGTGVGSATAGDVGKVLKVSDESPFTFVLADDDTGGGSGGGTAAVATSTGETAGNLAYWTSTSATPALLGKVATSSVTINAPLTSAGTAGFVVGGSGWTLDIDDIKAADLDLTDITLADFTNDAGFITLGSLSATWPITYNSGTGAFTWSGLATTSNPTAGQLLYSNGSTGLIPVATTTLTASSPLALSNPVFKIGGSDSVLTLDTSGTWSGNAGTATSLAANGTNCSAGSYALGVDASGNAEGCTDATTEIDSAISTHASNAEAHQALVTLAGSLDYITLSGQQITRNAIDLATDVTGTLPYTNGGTGTSTAGVLGDVLSWNGSNWQGTATSSLNISASAAGSDTQVQFNDGGTALGGDAGLTYNKTTDTLTLVYASTTAITAPNIFGSDVSITASDAFNFFGNLFTIEGTGVRFGNGVVPATNYANLDFDGIATTDKTFTFPNESGSFLLSPFTTGLTSNAVPYGDGDNTVATSSNLTFNGTTLTANTLNLTNALGEAYGGTGLTSLGSGVATWLGTPSSANLATAVTGETGSGALVFGTSPTFTTSALSPVFSSTAADPADAGVLRLGNAEVIGWEASPAGTDVTLSVNSSEHLVLTGGGAFIPSANDGASLGVSGTAFSDLFLASGAVINFAAGNYTMTHSSGLLTLSGALTASAGTATFGVLAGALDAGGATSFEIPNGTAPTVDAIGEIALDTTDNQLLIATSTNSSFPAVIPLELPLFSITVGSTTPEFISSGSLPIDKWASEGREITRMTCRVSGGTSKVVNVTDGTNDTETITCGTTQTADNSVDTNSTFTAGENWALEFGATTGSVNYVTFTAYGRISRE